MSAEERRLSAIMFTDIVGYSALSERDEALTMELLERHHQLLRPLFPKHRGNEIKTIGDAFLVEFHSALEAVLCAIEMQTTISEHNNSVEESRRFQIRIGIHLGDVIHRDGDVYGDGVNIASRIESLAEPGGICISEFFYDQIHKRLDTPLLSLGKQKLKNIEEPIEIYKVVLPWEQGRVSKQQAKKPFGKLITTWGYGVIALVLIVAVGFLVFSGFNSVPGDAPSTSETSSRFPIVSGDGSVSEDPSLEVYDSIAVLPFTNLSADPENEYFSDGLTEELINAFAKVEGLRVISRTSAFSFKGRDDIDIKSIGAQLGVATILEGSVRRSGETVRITAQLINVADDSHIWSEQYDREMEDVFEVQGEIARSIVDALKIEFALSDEPELALADTENLDAYNLYLQGRFFWNKRTKDGFERAIEYFNEAVALDPTYAKAYAGLADTYSLMANYQHMPVSSAYEQAKEAALKAIELNERLAEAHTSLAFILENYDHEFEDAETEYLRAIELSPGYATAHHWYSIMLDEMGRIDDSIREATLAYDLDPLSPIINVNLAFRLVERDRNEEAKRHFETALSIDPNFPNAYQGLMSIRIFEGDFAGAEALMKRLIEIDPDNASSQANHAVFLAQQGRFEEAMDEITKVIEENEDSQEIVLFTAKGLIEYFSQDYEAAIATAEQALELDPSSGSALGLIGGAYFMNGDIELGVEYNTQSLAAFLPAQDVEAMDLAYQEEGIQGYVEKGIELIKGDSNALCGRDAYGTAMLNMFIDNYERSLECLEIAYQDRSENILNINVEPVFEPIRDEPRFQELLEEIGFPAN